MTAHAMAGDEQKSLQAGMNGHVTKPIDPEQLFATLQKWIQPNEKQFLDQGPEVSAEGPEADPAVLDKEQLPVSLPGFDLEAGLSRLMGNKRLYRKLLLDFGANYGGVANEIREALEGGDFEQTHSLVHNLKGLAGNLEAKDLQVAAVKMEKLVKGKVAKTASNEELNLKLTNLESALNQALGAVQTLGHVAENKTNASSKDAIASLSPEQIKRLTERIKAAVELGDVIKIKSIAEELKSESNAIVPFTDELIRLADDFDFDGIQKIALELDG